MLVNMAYAHGKPQIPSTFSVWSTGVLGSGDPQDNWWWLLWSNDVLEQQNAVCGPRWKLGSRRKRQGSV